MKPTLEQLTLEQLTLERLNQLAPEAANAVFIQCCHCRVWAGKMVAGRPFADHAALSRAADENWQGLDERDYLQAFDGHPQIGDINSLRAKYANAGAQAQSKALSGAEQSAVGEAGEALLHTLKQGNQDYLDKFGFIFIVCATGKSAAEMLALLQARLPNDRATELNNAAEQQGQIFHLRLEKLL